MISIIKRFFRWRKEKCWNKHRCGECIYFEGIWSEDGLFLKGFRCTRHKNIGMKEGDEK